MDQERQILWRGFKPNEGEIHVLVVVPEGATNRMSSARIPLTAEQTKMVVNEVLKERDEKESAYSQSDELKDERARKRARYLSSLPTIEHKRLSEIARTLAIDSWPIGGVELNIHLIEPDFPDWFYVRKETQDIFKLVNANMQKNLKTVFVGTPGVGKSMLVVLLAFYMALRQKKRVVLFRKQKTTAFTMLYLDPMNNDYRRTDAADIADLDYVDPDVELYLDGFVYNAIDTHHKQLIRYRLLATSAQYKTEDNDSGVLRLCLVPFWSKSDLKKIGAHLQSTKKHGVDEWTEDNINERYYYSGGNLRGFLLTSDATNSIDQALALVLPQGADILKSQQGLALTTQIDRLRMTTVVDGSSLDKYWLRRCWIGVITSEYALRKIGSIVQLSFYEELWSKARTLGDDGLMGIAFENCVHWMATNRKKIELKVREYDREKGATYICCVGIHSQFVS